MEPPQAIVLNNRPYHSDLVSINDLAQERRERELSDRRTELHFPRAAARRTSVCLIIRD